MNSDQNIRYGVQRMLTVCSIAHRRIRQTKKLLGIPQDVSRDEYLVTRNEETIELVSETVNDINKMLDSELARVGVKVALVQEVSENVDVVRSELAKLITILAKGFKAGPKVDKVAERDNDKPVGLMVVSIVSIIVAVFLVIIAVDSDK